ncbi:MAG: flagellar motor protein MotB [Clostridium sp.]|nr:flagellar motor protein MotB [Clostridium sp.]
MAKRKDPPAEEGSPAWMATFSDLMNLLLCFFVLLFASSTMDEGKIQKIAASFDNISFTVMEDGNVSLVNGDMMSGGVTQIPDVYSIMTEAGKNIEGTTGEESVSSSSDAEKLSDQELKEEYEARGEAQSEEMYEEIVQLAESYRIDTMINIDYNEQYVELDLEGSILFESGSAQIRDDQKLFLQKIASILTKYKYCIIEIEGHTDNVPVSSSAFENNRQLSTERARNVYEYIIAQENFIESNMKIAGYGESKPIASNATEEGRAKNRRVCIKIYNSQNSE